MRDAIERLTVAVAAAASAHHAAFAADDGADPEWPLWYAHHLVADVRTITSNADLTVSELVHVLIAADRDVSARGLEDWPRRYAEWIAGFAGK